MEAQKEFEKLAPKDAAKKIASMEKQMFKHARDLEFEEAAAVRDKIDMLKQIALGPGINEPSWPLVRSHARLQTVDSYRNPGLQVFASNHPGWFSECGETREISATRDAGRNSNRAWPIIIKSCAVMPLFNVWKRNTTARGSNRRDLLFVFQWRVVCPEFSGLSQSPLL